jgi:DNA-binding NarL/FixJ family response regulator
MRSHWPPRLPPDAPLEILDARQRAVLELRQRYPLKEVAAQLRLHPSTVTKIQQAALRRLRAAPKRSTAAGGSDAALRILSERQLAVLDHLASGATLAEVAAELGCALETARRIKKAAHQRLRLASAQARLLDPGAETES